MVKVCHCVGLLLLASGVHGQQGGLPPFKLLDRPLEMPIPTPQHLAYQGSMSALIHFGMATFFHDGDPGCTRQNWLGCDPKSNTTTGGCNSSNVESFAPIHLDTQNWVESFKALGVSSAVLTAKHGCGFLAWETNTTLPDGSPYRYHVPSKYPVAEAFVAATRAAGIGHGFYYSLTNNFYLNAQGHKVQPASTLLPGQANITQEQYEDLALNQVTELWTQFGALTEIWLDGGCGSMCDRVGQLVRSLQPHAVAFNGGGVSDSPVRWCGTEGGDPVTDGASVWSTAACGWCPAGSGSGDPPNSTGAVWYPSGVDVTLQVGDHWFYTPGASLHSISDLAQFYHKSVGMNGHLEIDFAIDRTGRVDPKHALAYAQFGAWIRSCYGSPVQVGELPFGQTSFVIALNQSTTVDRVALQEDQSQGQMVVEYTVEAMVDGVFQPFSKGVTVGAKRIDLAAPVVASALRFSMLSGFGTPAALTVSAFSPEPCDVTKFAYDV